ncbi:MAG: hypothetical protein ACLTVG_12610 [Coprococcus sp.]
MNIYLWKEDIEDGASVMTVEYRPVEYGKDYDVVNNPDIFELYIDGKEVKECKFCSNGTPILKSAVHSF